MLKSLKRAKGECVRMRAQHTERLDDDRAEYEERLAGPLRRRRASTTPRGSGATRPLRGFEGVAKRPN